MILSNLTRDSIINYLKAERRLDGRKAFEFRNLIIESPVSNKAEGSVRVKLGKTEVIAGIKMDVGVPYPDSKDQGNLIASAELSPLSHERHESGPPRIEAIELGRLVDRGLRESGFIDFKKLCIRENELVWNILVDVYAINDDGNLLDACAIASICAMKIAKMPKLENDKVVYGEWTDKQIPLTNKTPFTITIHKIGEKLVLDPTFEEEQISDGRITIGISLDKEARINSLQKGKEATFSVEELNESFAKAVEKAKELKIKIDKFVK